MQWLEENHDPELHDTSRTLQRFVLACIYHATYWVETEFTRLALGQGAVTRGWLQEDGWLTEPNECLWYGIQCTEQGQVSEIDLSYNFLTGTFPPETQLFKDSLTVLVLTRAWVFNDGDAGNAWLGEMSNLRELDLADTGFYYNGIHPAIGHLVNLEILDLSYAFYYGPLRDQVFANLQNLAYLDIGGNRINSTLVASIANLSKLRFMYADNSFLTGDLTIWTTPDQTPDLVELWIDNNADLGGGIPTELGQYSNLASLSFTKLGLTGVIPSELGNLSKMKQMWLYGNKLNGEIPSQLANMASMDRLELEANDLVGAMPPEICNIVWPRGFLQVLEADCAVSNPEVVCELGACCTCCGEECANNPPQPLNTEGSAGGGRYLRKLGGHHVDRSNTPPWAPEDRQKRRHEARYQRVRQRKDPAYAQAAAEKRDQNLRFHKHLQEYLLTQDSQ